MNKLSILIIRFSSLGDVILSTPIIKALKTSYGDSVDLYFLTSSEYAPLIENHPDLTKTLSFQRNKNKGLKGIRALLKEFAFFHKQYAFDVLIDMHGTLRSLAIRFFYPQIAQLWADKRTPERILLTYFKWNTLPKIHPPHKDSNRAGTLLTDRIIADFQAIFDKFDTTISYPSSTGLPSQIGPREHIVIVPSASFEEKRWPASYFYELIEKMLSHSDFAPYSFVILAGPQDDFCSIFNSLCELYPERVKNLQGKTTLAESANYLQSAKFCVGNDTGLPHIAEGFNTPVFVILGPTGEEFGFYPRLDRSSFIKKDLWCRPCSTNGSGFCIRKERYCLTTLSVQEVFEKLQRFAGTI